LGIKMKLTQLKLLLKIKNSSIRNTEKASINCTPRTLLLVEFLYQEKYLQSFFIKQNIIYMYFRAFNNICLLKTLKIISKSSSNKFLNYKDICRLKISNKNLLAISTDSNIKNLIDCKMKMRKGGKILFSV
jgi:ribosomal protein S8